MLQAYLWYYVSDVLIVGAAHIHSPLMCLLVCLLQHQNMQVQDVITFAVPAACCWTDEGCSATQLLHDACRERLTVLCLSYLLP